MRPALPLLAATFILAVPTPSHAAPLRSVNATRLAEPITVDGHLDDPAWTRCKPANGFWQREPNEGAPPAFATEFRIAYDDAALYVAIDARDPEPDKIRGLLTRRDEESSSDWVYVAVDSYHDRRTAFVFGLNAAGVQLDSIRYDDTQEDSSWNAVWEGATRIHDRGWSAEYRIPLSQLRFSGDGEQVWGLQVARVVQRTNEVSLWSPAPRDKPQFVSLFGELRGVQDLPDRPRVEILPYVVGGTRLSTTDPDDPFGDGVAGEGSIGIDAKYGVTKSLTLSATINPDFGQVEADPSEVNLTAQETFFQEKRPFFLEGADILRFSLGQGDGDGSVETMFYSRRIGAPPHGTGYDHGDYVEEDPTTSIIGATKLTGKTSSGWSLGVMNAVTAEESALVETESGDQLRPVIEPLTSYSVAKLTRDLGGGRTTVGGAITAVHRDSAGDLALHRQAYAGGANLSHRFDGDAWTLDLRLAGSLVEGTAEAIDATQRASQRYFQRPDADHLDYDPTRTSLAGAAALGSLGYNGKPYRWAVGFDTRSPGFEVNDLGFQRGADYLVNWLWGQLYDDKPGDHLNNYSVNFNAWNVTTFGPEHMAVGGNVNGNLNLKSFWGANAGIGLDLNRLDPGLLRGGPAVAADPAAQSWLNLWSDGRRRVRGNLSAHGYLVPARDSWTTSVNLSVAVQARSNLDLSVGPFVSVRSDGTQFVDQIPDEMGRAHYLLARIDQTTAGMTLRASYTLSPTLSFQLYAQPFVSAGDYGEFKEPTDPRASKYVDRYHVLTDAEMTAAGDLDVDVDRMDGSGSYSFTRPDFNFRELRSTAVLRWEYMPGSTLFLIWSQGRQSYVEDKPFRLGHDLAQLSDADGEHVILAKLTYWFGL